MQGVVLLEVPEHREIQQKRQELTKVYNNISLISFRKALKWLRLNNTMSLHMTDWLHKLAELLATVVY